ncbi:PadR family transcriptional regulator [Rothia halotolerans]|uniref:PadR family transcriptional regulator n=1 Tax=Rothia halotolerans TaxID=405770 RepID=UPI00101C7946|nr:PadR family transcriptional regulator [Rothia halotolerans]
MKQTSEWPGEWLRGVLGFAVLRMLDDGPTYGYAIAARLEEAGFGTVKGGTLYPLLGRLEAAGSLTVQWRAGQGGPGRKYYSITEEGRRSLGEQAASWRRFAEVVDGVLTGASATPGREPERTTDSAQREDLRCHG